MRGIKSLTTKQFLFKAKAIHGNKYDYSKVNYLRTDIQIKIICPVHGVFKQRPDNHLQNHGCPKCKNLKLSISKLKSTEQFIKEAKIIHGSKYNYSLVNYTHCDIKVKIICPEHNIFKQAPHCHLSGQGCPVCKSSKGELQIKQWLKENNILFVPQKKFFDCKNQRPLPFDFYLPQHNTCIEYDGRQHFESIKGWGGIKTFKQTQLNDKIKNEYCQCNNISLIRIAFHVKDINDKLSFLSE